MARLGHQPAVVDASADGQWLYLWSGDEHALRVLSAPDLAGMARVPVGKGPYDVKVRRPAKLNQAALP
jgi:hypothetical protein